MSRGTTDIDHAAGDPSRRLLSYIPPMSHECNTIVHVTENEVFRYMKLELGCTVMQTEADRCRENKWLKGLLSTFSSMNAVQAKQAVTLDVE